MYDLPQSQETLMQRPFELSSEELRECLEEMVQVTISDLVSEFLLMPMGSSFSKYWAFAKPVMRMMKRRSQNIGKNAQVIDLSSFIRFCD
jgi:hypothetical protein